MGLNRPGLTSMRTGSNICGPSSWWFVGLHLGRSPVDLRRPGDDRIKGYRAIWPVRHRMCEHDPWPTKSGPNVNCGVVDVVVMRMGRHCWLVCPCFNRAAHLFLLIVLRRQMHCIMIGIMLHLCWITSPSSVNHSVCCLLHIGICINYVYMYMYIHMYPYADVFLVLTHAQNLGSRSRMASSLALLTASWGWCPCTAKVRGPRYLMLQPSVLATRHYLSSLW